MNLIILINIDIRVVIKIIVINDSLNLLLLLILYVIKLLILLFYFVYLIHNIIIIIIFFLFIKRSRITNAFPSHFQYSHKFSIFSSILVQCALSGLIDKCKLTLSSSAFSF